MCHKRSQNSISILAAKIPSILPVKVLRSQLLPSRYFCGLKLISGAALAFVRSNEGLVGQFCPIDSHRVLS
jgi:hypothetical protein